MAKKKYVVGFVGSHQVVYGPEHFGMKVNSGDYDIRDYASRMTPWQARRAVEALDGSPAEVYELVPVDPETLKRKA